MKFNFNFESRENYFLTSDIRHPRWYLSPRFTVIDLQSDYTLKEMFHEKILIAFYSSLFAEKCPCMKKFGGKLFSIFGSTNICEQSFSCIKINKNKHRCSLTDVNLHALMRISTTNITPNLKKNVQERDRVHFSH